MWAALLWVLIVGGFVYALWAVVFQGLARVEPAGRERLVVRDIFGRMFVKGPGDHFLPFWQVAFVRLSINRESVEVIDREVKASNGVGLRLSYRFDIIAGRPFGKQNHGHLLIPPSDIDKQDSIQDELIKQAVTRIDWSSRHKFVTQLVSAVVADVFGAWTDEELMLPAETKPVIPDETREESWVFKVQQVREPDDPGPPIQYFTKGKITGVTTSGELYHRLSTLIELKVNHDKLINIGVNVISFQVTSLRYKDEEVQSSVEMKARMRNLRKAMARTDGKLTELSDVEILAATKTGELGQAVLGKGIAEAGKSLGEGLKGFGKNNSTEEK